jgi:hypothetical protein
MGQGKGARARQKAKREEWLKNKPSPWFHCKVCKHEEVVHQLFVGYCILPDCDCQSMNGIALIKGENK